MQACRDAQALHIDRTPRRHESKDLVRAGTRSQVIAHASANRLALERSADVQPVWIDIARAADVVERLQQQDLLHAGPPLVGWSEACAALRGAVAGTLVLEGEAPDAHAALGIAASGRFRLRSSAELNVASTFGGVITCSTPVLVIADRRSGRRTFAAINEGRGRALRYGCTDPETLERVRWLHGRFASVVGAAVRDAGGIELSPILEHALQMGDEGHSRHKAASALLLSALAPHLVEVNAQRSDIVDALSFLGANDFFFLPLAMAAAKNVVDQWQSIEGAMQHRHRGGEPLSKARHAHAGTRAVERDGGDQRAQSQNQPRSRH